MTMHNTPKMAIEIGALIIQRNIFILILYMSAILRTALQIYKLFSIVAVSSSKIFNFAF